MTKCHLHVVESPSKNYRHSAKIQQYQHFARKGLVWVVFSALISQEQPDRKHTTSQSSCWSDLIPLSLPIQNDTDRTFLKKGLFAKRLSWQSISLLEGISIQVKILFDFHRILADHHLLMKSILFSEPWPPHTQY